MTTRRTFIRGTAECLLASALQLHAEVRLHIGIGTYSYHSLSTDEMIAQLKTLGIQEIEASRGQFMVMSHPPDELFRSTRAKLDRAGIRCVSYYSATLKDDQDVATAVRFAKLLGASNITGDATGKDLLQHIDRSVTQAGLTFGIHNHFFKGIRFPYESPEEVLAALQGLSERCGATADTGQFASCGYDPADAVRKLGPRLKLVHLKDVQSVGDEVNVLLGTGIAKIPQVMEELRRQNFRHLVAIEYEKEGPVDEDMRKEVAYARKLAG